MGAYGSPQLGVPEASYRVVSRRHRGRRVWAWFLAGMATTLALEFLALVAAALVATPRG